MSQSTIILCPGQGAQVVGMGRDYYEKYESARKIFDRANEVLGFDLKQLCFEGPEDRLGQTDISQPAIYVTSIACYHAGIEAGVIQPMSITTLAGLSLGEYTALHLAGVFSFEDGLKLVAARGKYMQEAAVTTPSGMVAISGADETKINELCVLAAGGQVLGPANYNAPGQIVVSGHLEACQRMVPMAEAAGFRATALKVAGAFHSSLMQSGADRMGAELNKVKFTIPNISVYSNVTASKHGDPAMIKSLLVDQIVKPVRWEQTMQLLLASGEARWIELAPGRVLTGLLKKINRRLPVDSLATAEMLAGLKA